MTWIRTTASLSTRTFLGATSFLTELSQPVWEEQSTGKVRLIKAPDGAPSPNFFAVACLVFADETRSMGLEARVWLADAIALYGT